MRIVGEPKKTKKKRKCLVFYASEFWLEVAYFGLNFDDFY